jgi:cell division ATPase FtsA
MFMTRPITVIDLGSTRIAAATAGMGRDGSVFFSALENLDSRGIRGGEITDLNKAIEDISLIKRKLEDKEKKKLKKVYVTTRGADVEMALSRGMVPLSKSPREITKRDVKKCMEAAGLVKLPMERTVMQKIVRGFIVDGASSNVKNPLGLYGIKLEVESFIATANRSKVQNITKCVDHAGFLLDGIYLSSLASADSVLDNEEKETGALLLDIGEALTEAAVFKNSMLRNCRIIKKGAGMVLDKSGHVDKAKVTALLKKACAELSAVRGDFSSVILAGGGALLDGVVEESEKVFGLPVRMGRVRNAPRGLSQKDSLIHTPTIGLINRLANEYKEHREYHNPFRRTLHNLLNIYETYF